MKNLFRYSFLMLAISAMIFTGCKDDNATENPTTKPSQVLMDHLVNIDMDLNHVLKNGDGAKFVMGAPADGNVSGKYVIDIRSAAKFAEGHITNAVNVPDFKNILTEAAKADKPILVVCYTGQTACYATSLLRLYGYHDAQALKWGMSGWNATTDSWTPQIDNLADGHANWTYDATSPSSSVYDIPEFMSTGTTGEMILKERVEYVVSQGFKTVKADDVLETPSNYYINNYFSTTDYGSFGHINGAYRLHTLLIKPTSADISAVTNLDPDKKVVTYCYTGQTSAVITAYLRVLGYDAYSLTFGMNKLFNSEDSWTTNQWGGDSNPKNLPLVQ
ncbi:MAG: rhodanese-like domain-containing protein [Carboxylicivirga sp.]|jgi:rhodanese-related sulfurtransferase|nr:rhodanese-like domain-containing protein [Carboxylicivirga sp.]